VTFARSVWGAPSAGGVLFRPCAPPPSPNTAGDQRPGFASHAFGSHFFPPAQHGQPFSQQTHFDEAVCPAQQPQAAVAAPPALQHSRLFAMQQASLPVQAAVQVACFSGSQHAAQDFPMYPSDSDGEVRQPAARKTARAMPNTAESFMAFS
jgi:hypothetical protein